MGLGCYPELYPTAEKQLARNYGQIESSSENSQEGFPIGPLKSLSVAGARLPE